MKFLKKYSLSKNKIYSKKIKRRIKKRKKCKNFSQKLLSILKTVKGNIQLRKNSVNNISQMAI